MKEPITYRASIFMILCFIVLTSACISRDDKQSQASKQSQGSLFKDLSYTGKYLDISNETEDARTSFWKPDGTIVFIVGRYSNNVSAYKLDEP